MTFNTPVVKHWLKQRAIGLYVIKLDETINTTVLSASLTNYK